MNAERLIKGFDLLGDGPETIQQFRKLVVGLAIAGKLNSPDHEHLDPQSLTKAIDERKRALTPKGAIRKQVSSPRISADDLPMGFTNPQNFIHLGSVARIEKGLTGIMKAKPGPYPLVVTAEERASCDHYDFDGAAAIVPLVSSAGHGKASLQRLHYQEGKFALGSILAAIFPHAPDLISARFLYEYLTAFKDELLVSRMIGTANVSLSIGKVSEVPVPLVAPIVQRKVDELMALCDKLEVARAEREATRDRLEAASLARLDAHDPETFQDDVRFALDVLPALTTRPDQIKQLHQTILNLAVRGKLVPQDPKDEPASALLKRIANEKARLVKAGEIRKQESFEPVAGADMMFGIPKTWEWVPATFPAYVVSDMNKKVQTKDVLESGDFPVVDQGKVFIRGYCNDPIKAIRVKAPLILFGDHTRETKLIDFDFVVGADGVKLLQPVCLFTRYYYLALQWLPLDSRGYGRHFKLLRASFIPLPPLAEQHRIVAKVDELTALCDRLEASLTATDDARRRLLDALLAEALTPIEKIAA
jgi:type I restriction enzyme S subunit